MDASTLMRSPLGALPQALAALPQASCIDSPVIVLFKRPCFSALGGSSTRGRHNSATPLQSVATARSQTAPIRSARTTASFKSDASCSARWGFDSCRTSSLACHAQSSEAMASATLAKVAEGAVQGSENDGSSEGSTAEDSEQGNVQTRDALEANLAETSSDSEHVQSRGDLQANLAETLSSSERPSNSSTTVNGYGGVASTSTLVLDRKPITGGALDFRGAALTTIRTPLAKKIVLVRHGLSSWNAEGRIQGSSDLSVLSDEGIAQAERCKAALARLKFSSCFASPISRAKTSAEVIWTGRDEPLIFLDTLKEANLLFLEGMRNVDAKVQHPELYRAWREDPVNFHVDGVFPVVKLWQQAKEAWREILSAEGELILVVTHKSILRALLCTALGMGPDRFRAVDINNGGISVFSVNSNGEPLLQCLNMTAHLHAEGVFY